MKILFPCILFLFGFIDSALPKTLIVPTDYAAIQTAIDAAGKGDTVYVLNGIYNIASQIECKSHIWIIGQDNQNTIIKGSGFVCGDAEEVYIENFKITNCGSAVSYYYNAGAFSANVSIVIKNNIMENINDACIYLNWNSYSNKAVIDSNTFRNCGTAISTVRADNSVIISNNLIYGCNLGLDLNTYSYPLVINNVIAYSKTNGISVSAGKAKIISNTVVHSGSSGIYVTHNAMPVENNIICFNHIGISDYYSGTIGDYNDVYGNGLDYGIPKGEHDISEDPLFVDTLSFHLSTASPCIDAGDPFSDYYMEPDYNGGRINLGAYGNTAGAAVSNPTISVVSDIYFDTLNIGESDTAETWIKNEGITRLNIESIHTTSPGQFSVIGNTTAYILPGDSLKVDVVFSPDVTGDVYSELIISTNNKDNQNTSIKLYGVVNYISVPVILKISDVPNDQGGWVKVYFAKSMYDTDSLVLEKTASPEFYSVEIDADTGWTAAASTAAYGKTVYSVLVHTTKDSTGKSNGLINFRVIAAMNEGNYVSKILSGYSVDNLFPSVPSELTAKIAEGSIRLNWKANTENDFNYYTIYRSKNNGDYKELAKTIDLSYLDTQVEWGVNYSYVVSATDFSGNESDYSAKADVVLTGIYDEVGVPVKNYLSQNYPNPFNPTTTIQYSIPKESFVTIKIYDVLGKEITTIVNERKAAGNYSVDFNANNLTSGIYFYRMQAGSFVSTKKFDLLK